MAEAQVIRLHPQERAPLARGAEPGQPPKPPADSQAATWERRAAAGLRFLRHRVTGDYPIDDFGFDPELTEATVLAAARQLYRKWFRTEVTGAHHLPGDSGALIVANHAGALWALDGVMTATAVHEETPNHRFLRLLAADLVFTTPVLGPLARKTGSTLACHADAERLLGAGELVGVWPEGFKGIGKPFSERYKLQRFGRGGFVSAALRTGAPIIPTAIVGSEEIYPMLGNAKTLARVLGLPHFPLTPTFPWLGPLGLIPLPSKWHIEFGEPIETAEYGPEAAEDPMLVFEITDRVREQIQGSLYRVLMQRRSVWH
ncbi:MAG TPA: lysophospholipid acyltransferase family protein [Jatrophihabitans sp.]|jgi:1-acyl-sn-glycerol-3-phosphate acyltransferase|uniref:lysophospholipid acyltransferase family protein n=1 Tax=Jatrophihabitans sp. TaxID=1932789 RepID=UPI002F0CC53B